MPDLREAPDDPRADIERRLKAQAGWTDVLDINTDELRSIADIIDAIRWGVGQGATVVQEATTR